MRNLNTEFDSNCTSLHSHQCVRFPFPLNLHQRMFFLFVCLFWVFDDSYFDWGKKGILMQILICISLIPKNDYVFKNLSIIHASCKKHLFSSFVHFFVMGHFMSRLIFPFIFSSCIFQILLLYQKCSWQNYLFLLQVAVHYFHCYLIALLIWCNLACWFFTFCHFLR